MDSETNHISINAEGVFEKIQHPFMIKSLKKLGIEEPSFKNYPERGPLTLLPKHLTGIHIAAISV